MNFSREPNYHWMTIGLSYPRFSWIKLILFWIEAGNRFILFSIRQIVICKLEGTWKIPFLHTKEISFRKNIKFNRTSHYELVVKTVKLMSPQINLNKLISFTSRYHHFILCKHSHFGQGTVKTNEILMKSLSF